MQAENSDTDARCRMLLFVRPRLTASYPTLVRAALVADAASRRSGLCCSRRKNSVLNSAQAISLAS
jgi:hypothetical protein